MALIQEKLKNSDIELKMQLPDQPLYTLCNSVQISQVIMNLISNSADAISDLLQRWIEIDVREQGDMIKISVTDSGHGITPSLVDKIMTPFFTTKDTGKGTGLGLSISRRIIEKHDSQLKYELNQGHTSFHFLLKKS